jgi:MFS family permease
MMFIMGAGLSQNIGSQLVCRFLAGFFGEAPLSTVGGSLADMWDPMERLVAFPVFASKQRYRSFKLKMMILTFLLALGFLGPVIGPIMGGFIAESSVISWRWTEWVTLIMSGLVLASIVLFQPETYEPILLKWKASQLRHITKDDRYLAPSEIRRHSFTSRMLQAMYRPFLMTIQEPTIILWTAYLTVIYMILFGFLAGYSFIFGDTYHMSQGITGLMFLGMAVGLFLCSVPLTPLIYRWAKQELVAIKEANPNQIRVQLPPEFRLWYAMLGAPAIPISLFWMGWTANPTIGYWSPLLASVLFGYGILCVFISTYQYLIDTYEIYAASALTMITLVRYVAAGGMIEVTIPMYKNLGVHHTLTILACIAVVFTPVPYLFFRFGPWIRSKSKFAFGDN